MTERADYGPLLFGDCELDFEWATEAQTRCTAS
jgi:hypothetical protein